MQMQKILPEDFDFFPATYCLPHDMKEFMSQITEKRAKTFIVKPEAACQGKGIFLTRNPENIAAMATKAFADVEQDDRNKPMAPIIAKGMENNLAGQIPLMVVQRYMHKPLLIDGFKFDLRIYVNINGIAPLRVYIHKNGLARFATVPYQSPQPSNMNNLCMHLTNYAINKESEDFVQNDDENADD